MALCLMLIMRMAALHAPGATILGVHPVSVLLLVLYVFGVRLTVDSRREAMWLVREASETVDDHPSEDARSADTPIAVLSVQFASLSFLVGAGG